MNNSVSWQSLFDRARLYERTVDEISETLATQREQ